MSAEIHEPTDRGTTDLLRDLTKNAVARSEAARSFLTEQVDCLDAQCASWEQLYSREKADPGGGTAEPPFPALRLLVVPQWGNALSRGSSVFLQGLDDELYVRVQGPTQPVGMRFAARSGFQAHEGIPLVCEPLREAGDLFALRYLNGRGTGGLLWFCEQANPEHDLGSGTREIELWVTPEHGTPECSLGVVELPAISQARFRVDAAAESGRAPKKVVDALQVAISAYTLGHPERFCRAVAYLREQRGDPRDLSRVQALWLSAMAAEIWQAGRDQFERYGCHVLAGHPQLMFDLPALG